LFNYEKPGKNVRKASSYKKLQIKIKENMIFRNSY
jgi:hypothetical protein